MARKRLVLIDGNALVHRAYHAIPPLTSPTGEPTNAVYGFTTMLFKALSDLKPDYIASVVPSATICTRSIKLRGPRWRMT